MPMQKRKEYEVRGFTDEETTLANEELRDRLERNLQELSEKEATMPFFNLSERNKAKKEIAELRKSLNTLATKPLTREELFSEKGQAARLNETPKQLQLLIDERKRIRELIRQEQNPSLFSKIKGFFSKNTQLQSLEKQLKEVQKKIADAQGDQGSLANKYAKNVVSGEARTIGDMEEIVDATPLEFDPQEEADHTIDEELQSSK